MAEAKTKRSLPGAVLVASGIFASRVLGLVRTSLMARYLGATGDYAADAWSVAVRIPQVIQNLLGEGVLSASFIPVYTRLITGGPEQPADRIAADEVAGAVGAAIGAMTTILAIIGVIAAPVIVRLMAWKFPADKLALTTELTRIFFPSAAVLAMAAWCIGILNTHRRFFVSYISGAFWNLAMIATLLFYGPRLGLGPLAIAAAWGSVAGAVLQVAIQLPLVLRVAPHLRIRLAMSHPQVKTVLRNFVPVAVSRGALQISSLIDLFIADLLPQGSPTLLSNASTLALLPVSLFGMAISAAELPELSSGLGTDAERGERIRTRLIRGLRHIAYFVVPSAVAFIAIGNVLVALLFQHGRFTAVDTRFAWGVLAGSSVGLLAQTLSRLYSSTFYAIGDTRTPLRFTLIRLALTASLGWLVAIPLPAALGIDRHWGTAGLTITAGMAGWVEFALLRRAIEAKIGPASIPGTLVARLWAIAATAGAVAYGIDTQLAHTNRYVRSIIVIGVYGALYIGGTFALRVPEARGILARFGIGRAA